MTTRGRPAIKITRHVELAEVGRQIQQARKTKNLRYLERLQAIQYLTEGYPRREVARLLNRNQATVMEWVKLWNQNGFPGLEPQFEPRDNARLRWAQVEALRANLRQDPRDFGYLQSYWSVKLIFLHLKHHYKVEYHPHSWYRCLKQWHITAKVPRILSSQQDPKKVEAYWQETLPELKQKKEKQKKQPNE